MTVSIRRESFASLAEEWERLVEESSAPAPFVTPQWQEAWWQEFGGEPELLLLAGRRDGQLVGIAPLMMVEDLIAFIGSEDVCDYLDFVIAPGCEELFLGHLLEYLEALRWSAFDLHALPEASAALTCFVPLLRERAYVVQNEVEEVCPEVILPATWEEYLASLTRKDRHELRRKLRRLASAPGVRLSEADGQAIEEDVEDFLRLLRLSRGDKGTFMNPRRASFFRAIVQRYSQSAKPKLFFLEVAGKRVSSVLLFDCGNSYMLYNSGYDPDYSYLSVGLLLKALCLQEAIAQGKQRFDFLRGAEPYKYDLGGRDVPIYHCRAERP